QRAPQTEVADPLERSGDRADVPRKPVLPAEPESRSDHRPFRRTFGYEARFRGPACRFPDRSRAAGGMPRVAEEGRVDRARERNPILDERDGYPDRGEPVEEVGGPIERVDDPSQTLDRPTRLLAEHRHVRCFLLEERPDRGLARDVDLGHPIAREALGFALRARPCAADGVPAHERGSSGGDAHPFEVDRHGGTLPTGMAGPLLRYTSEAPRTGRQATAHRFFCAVDAAGSRSIALEVAPRLGEPVERARTTGMRSPSMARAHPERLASCG